ncbi:MAG: hypothetical protein V4760_08040 [Bdellovibrionota bacterium]
MLLKTERGFSIVQALIAMAFVLVALVAIMPMVRSLTQSNETLAAKLQQLDTKNAVVMAFSNSKVCGCQVSVTFDSTVFPNTPLDPLVIAALSSYRPAGGAQSSQPAGQSMSATYDSVSNLVPTNVALLDGQAFVRAPTEVVVPVTNDLRSGCLSTSKGLVNLGVKGPGGLTPTSIALTSFLAPLTGTEWRAKMKIEYQQRAFSTPLKPTEIDLRLQVDSSNPTAARVTCCGSANDDGSPMSCSPTEVPATTTLGSDLRVEYWKLVGQYDPTRNAGCTAPATYMERWKRGTFYLSATNVDATCTLQPDGQFLCINPVTPEVMMGSGCF